MAAVPTENPILGSEDVKEGLPDVEDKKNQTGAPLDDTESLVSQEVVV